MKKGDLEESDVLVTVTGPVKWLYCRMNLVMPSEFPVRSLSVSVS